MQNPMISIIIPVYRAEEYIVQCLQSIQNQTFQNYEVILVNDGSPDQTACIAEQFIREQKLDNFRMIHKENGGVSSARNAGLRLSGGQWIAFIDSDDWVEPQYLQNMMDSVAKHQSDLCLCGFDAYEMDANRFDPWSNYPQEYGQLPQDLPALTSIDYIWGRLYKNSILQEHHIFFNEQIRYCEDNAFNFDYIRRIRSFSCVDAIGYHNRRGHGSALSKSMIRPEMRIGFLPHAEQFWNAFSQDILIQTLQNNRSLSWIMWNVVSTAVVVDILGKRYADAKQRIASPMATAVVANYHPRTKKDRVMLFFWKHSFLGLKLLVRTYYGNFQKIKRHKKFFKFISH